jgi:hypothetical protein
MRRVTYTDLVMDIVVFDGCDIITSSANYQGMTKRQRKIAEYERRVREEELEEEYDEIDGIEDADY